MRFQPKTSEEIERAQAARGPLKPGIYDFEVVGGEDTTSKAGNEMIVVELQVYDSDGNRRKIFDWLVEAMEFKLRHIAETTGLLPEYERGAFSSDDLIGKSGKVKLGVKKQPGFPDKNVVLDYVAPETNAPTAPAANGTGRAQRAKGGGDIDDEIPFAPEWR